MRKDKMAQAEGVVTYAGFKKLPKAIVWSFAIGDDDDRVWYRTGFTKPCRTNSEDQIEAGDEVKFVFNKTQYGNEVDMDKFKVTMIGAGAPPKKAWAKKGGNNAVAKDDYWKNKDDYDKLVTQPQLDYRFSLATAKDIVLEAKKMEILPKAKSKAAELDLLVEQIDTMANALFDRIAARKVLCINPKTKEEDVPEEELEEASWDEEDWDE